MLDGKIAVVTGAGSVTSKPEDMMRNSRQTCTGLLIAVVATVHSSSPPGRASVWTSSPSRWWTVPGVRPS